MCGLAGCHGLRHPATENAVRKMLETMLHRGYSHFEVDSPAPHLCLGVNRLEIVDREHGSQPKCSGDGRFHVIMNGEIYNHAVLRAQLIKDGFAFATDTDTEVLATALSAWGVPDTLQKISGMYAFAAWDNLDRKLYLVRDPMGIKPLYMATDNQIFYFASEIKGLCAILPGERISSLPPGHMEILNETANTNAVSAYFHLPAKLPVTCPPKWRISPGRLRKTVSEAVKKRVCTDLPVAVLLSGGIDSSIILHEALKYHPGITPFVIGADDALDVVSAKRFCRELGVTLRHIPLSIEEAIALIPQTVDAIETFEPNHIRSGVASFALARHISRAGFRVALCGEGADELFAGYPEFIMAAANGTKEEKILAAQLRFLRDLHRTQLQRVDRTGMAHTLEIRTPFLDRELVALAVNLPFTDKLRQTTPGAWTNKWLLREAYRGILPDWLVERNKCVLSEGAGLGANGQDGPFYDHARRTISQNELKRLQAQYPEYGLKNAEEALYFKYFNNRFHGIQAGLPRPAVTRI